MLYLYNQEKLISLAKSNFTLPNGDRPCLSFNKGSQTSKELGNTKIFIEKNYNADTIIKIIRRLLAVLDCKVSELWRTSWDRMKRIGLV